MTDFKHKTVVITGATGGIGRALSWRFASAGARIVLLDIDAEHLPVVQNQIERAGVDVLSIHCDITDAAQCQAAMQQIVDQFGGIDVLINNAGVSHRSPFASTTLETFRRVMEVNYFGALHCTQAALPCLIERRGMIITLSSTGGFAPMMGRGGYSASKHALHGLFESLRMEVKQQGVHVMMVCPGATSTQMHENIVAAGANQGAVPQRETQKMVSPQAVAEAVFHGAQRRKRLVRHSRMSKTGWFYWKFFPALFERRLYRQWQQEQHRDKAEQK